MDNMNYILTFSSIFFLAMAMILSLGNNSKSNKASIIIPLVLAVASSVYLILRVVQWAVSSSYWLTCWFVVYAKWLVPLLVVVSLITYFFRQRAWVGISISLILPLLLQVTYYLYQNNFLNRADFVLYKVLFGEGWHVLGFSVATALSVLSVKKGKWIRVYYLLIWFAVEILVIFPQFIESLDSIWGIEPAFRDKQAIFHSSIIDLILIFVLVSLLQLWFIVVVEKLFFVTRKTSTTANA